MSLAPDGGARTLVLGHMPKGADPQHCLAAGPWCFAGREDAFDEWEHRFTFAPEPLQNPDALDTAAKQANALYVDTLSALAASLCPYSGELPQAYWETLLTPWGTLVARQIVERLQRIKAMTREWGDLPVRVPLLPENCSFEFQTDHDVTFYGALGTTFNHWLLSRLLEGCWPNAWTKELLPPAHEIYGERTPHSLKNCLKSLANAAILSLPFPRLKGMSLWQSMRFSLELLRPRLTQDNSLPLADTFGSAATGAHARLPIDPLPLFLAALPLSLARLRHPRALRRQSRSFLRVASIQVYENAAYRQKLAIWRARGNRLMYVQHGCGYGQRRTSCSGELVEYAHHAFATWGWTAHHGCRGNFIPLPYPQLAKLASKKAGRLSDSRKLLFVGTEISAFGYRLDSWPTPLQMLHYRRGKERFFYALDRDIHTHTLYRPYFSVPGTLRDADWLMPRFPELRLCTGPLARHMLDCRLLVLDHPGTSLHEAMAADIPVILYWEPGHWPLTPDAETLLDMLAKAEIWHCAPDKAALKVQAVWGNPDLWWRCAHVQQARRNWCASYAMTVQGSENPHWIKALREL
ncbi:MAG: conserved hypothetical protein [Candidatus Desulfovibrio kirbyi]|uniref:Transferase, LIC12162 family n=1 Tax=Candidatus Desulfovibrio kirbyi TaxID=2696086 RepID=A0A6L2R4F3_9BACT|nr:MAG: conserved hypothetical protein [Candidatus Desulfovibrio kirbyi]